MDLVLFDERRVASEDLEPRYWVEVITHINSDSPSVSSRIATGARLDEILEWARQAVTEPQTRVNVYVLFGGGTASDALSGARIASFT